MTTPHDNDVEAARAALRAAVQNHQAGRVRPKTKAAKIRELRDEIAELRARKFTWQDISEALGDTLKASPDTLRIAIGSAKTAANAKRRSRPKKNDPETAAPPRSETSPVPTPKTKRFGPPDL